MNNKEKMKMLKEYIKTNISPILIDCVQKDFFENSIVIDAKCSKEELNEIYDNEKTLPPKWYQRLVKENKKILIINNIDSIPLKEQKKFVEIIKYRKVSIFELPKDVIIIIISKNINSKKIDEEIFSLSACIGG